MKFNELINKWVKKQKWEDEVTYDNESTESNLTFSVGVNEQAIKVYIEGNETRQWLSLFMYTPFNCKSTKSDEMLKLLNNINQGTYYGKLILVEDGRIQYKQIIYLSPNRLDLETLEAIYGTGLLVFEHWLDVISEIALTKLTFDDWEKKQSKD